MINNNKIIGAGIITAITSSLCCITPVLILIAGTGGIASTFAWIEPFRPFLIIITLCVLALAWYNKIKSDKLIDCDCDVDEKIKFTQKKSFLSYLTLFTILMLTFPYYAHIFYPKIINEHVINDITKIRNVEITIGGMTCNGCSEHVNLELSKHSGIIESNTSYENGIAKIKFDSSITNLSDIENVINKSGFKVTKKEVELNGN